MSISQEERTNSGICNIFIKIFDKKQKAGEILFQGAVNINNLPLSKHNDNSKAHAITKSHCEKEIERDEQKVTEGEPDQDQMAQQVQSCLNTKNFMIRWTLTQVNT